MHLTDKALHALRPRSKTYKVTDARCPGLTVRVHPTGKKAWYIRKTVELHGKRQRIEVKIGDFPKMGCKSARLEFHQQTAVVRDALAHAVSAARAQVAGLEMGELLGMYLDDLAPAVSQNTMDTYRATVQGVSDLPMHSLRCNALTNHIAREWFRVLRGGGYSRTYLKSIVRLHARALEWGIDEGLVDVLNCFAYVQRKELRRIRAKPKRSRVLTDAELRALWYWEGFKAKRQRAVEASTILRLLVLTGLRKSEIKLLHWSDVDAYEQHVPEMGETFDLLVIPAERTKTRRAYSVPILEPIRAVLDDYASRIPPSKRRGKMFPATCKAPNASILNALKREGVAHTLHDVRRTVATRLSAAGVPREWIEAVLQHTTKGNASDYYIHHAFIGQKVQALTAWYEILGPVVSPNAVLTLPAPLAPGELMGGGES